MYTPDKDSPAYVQLPFTVGSSIGGHASLAGPAADLPMSVHSWLLHSYVSREQNRLARDHRLLCRAMAHEPPPCHAVPLCFRNDARLASAAMDAPLAFSNADEDLVIVPEDASDSGGPASIASSNLQTMGKVLTTVIVRNICQRYTRAQLLDLLERKGLRLSCDFLYLPVDFSSGKTLGYAFLNFVSNDWAEFCHNVLNGERDAASGEGDDASGGMALKVAWMSAQQGLAANIRRYKNSSVMHGSVPDEYKPVLFAKGEAIPFPAPTRNIRCPQHDVKRKRTAAI